MILEGEGLAELHTHLGGSVALGHPLVDRARAGHRTALQGLLGVRRAGHRLRPARRPGSRRARPDLPLDRADPVVAARRRTLRARRDRRRVPLAADHDARAPLQPDEAEPGRRARPRPHHPRSDQRGRPSEHRVPAGPRRADPDDGPHVRPAPERDHRREGDPLDGTRHRGHRHRRAPARRGTLRVRAARSRSWRRAATPDSASRSTWARRAATWVGRRWARSSSTSGPIA